MTSLLEHDLENRSTSSEYKKKKEKKLTSWAFFSNQKYLTRYIFFLAALGVDGLNVTANSQVSNAAHKH